MSETPSEIVTRCGLAAVLGAPNVGKSTLVNRLVGSKVSIVSPKAQTTRSRIAGIAVRGATQIVFVDLPGIFEPKRRLDRAMIDAAWRGAADADDCLLVVDASCGLDDATRTIIEGVKERGIEATAVINKIDLIKPPMLLKLAAVLNEAAPFAATYMVSAATGDGIDDLLAAVAAKMPVGPFLYPDDQLTDLTERLLAAEITREQIYLQLHQELPYSAAVETERWEESPDGSVRIEQVIYVRRSGQRKIVIGEKGSRIKQIGAAARLALVELLGRTVHLFLHVKVAADWPEKREFYRAWGLEYDV